MNGSYRLTATNTYEVPMHQPAEKAESPASGITPRRKKILLWSAVAVGFCVLGGLLCTLAYRDDLLKHYAGKNDVSMTRLMLTLGADPETKTKNGSTPLILAASKGHEAVVRLLLEKGVNIEAKNKRHNTPLILAAWEGHEAAVRLLLEKGANIEATQNETGFTPLICAAAQGHEAVVRLLLDKGADIEAKTNFGYTPLIWAAQNGHEAVVRLLLAKGADVEAKDNFGDTVYEHRLLRDSIKQLLRSYRWKE